MAYSKHELRAFRENAHECNTSGHFPQDFQEDFCIFPLNELRSEVLFLLGTSLYIGSTILPECQSPPGILHF